MSRTRAAACIALACAACACEEHPAPKRVGDPTPMRAVAPTPSALAHDERASTKPMFVSGRTPIAPFVAEELEKAPARGTTLVYVGATWCEPCQRFHRALEAGELEAELSGFRFIDYDLDRSRDELLAAGYGSKLIPLFALPKSDGNASGQQIEGAIKGDGAVGNIVPRLVELARRDK